MVQKKKIKEWTTISLPNGLDEEIEKYLKTKEAYRLGLLSKAQVIAHCVRTVISSK